ncbi:MAG: rps3p [Thermoplasmatales archaeon]|nr:rps3p [Thermoplasmatales archaeon]
MANERKFIRENAKRSLIKKFLVKEIEGAGFGGMNIQRTPIGTRVNILVERPGMVIGKSGSKIKELTDSIRTKFNVDNPQIEIQEAGSSLAGKLTGERHRTEKFTEGHVKYCGETAKEVMDIGYATAKLKPGVLGVKVRIMKPDAKLPDEITYKLAVKEEAKPEPKVEIKQPEVKLEKKTDIKKITDVPGIGPSVVKKLEKAKITSLEELYTMNLDDLIAIDGIGNKTAELIVKNIRKLLEEGTENGSQS